MRVVECVMPPPVPVIVIGYVPSGAFLATVRMKSDEPEPGAAMEAGLKLALTPDGTPVAVKAIAESNPPETVVVTTAYPLWPRSRYPEVGETEMVKLPAATVVTVSETVVVSVVLPDAPVTVMVYVPVAVDELTAMDIVELPVPVMDVGLKLIVTPEGWPDADNVTAESNPSLTVLVIVEEPELPCTIETEAGEADKLKPGVEEVPASALIRPDPLGLPQPVAKS